MGNGEAKELTGMTHGQNQGEGWRWGREVGSAGVGLRDGEKSVIEQ